MFSEYFKELEEESIRDNFVIVYELLDELMDFGFPQTTDSKILQECVGLGDSHRVGRGRKEVGEGREVSLGPAAHPPCPPARYITQQGNKLETGKSRVPPTVTNAVSWRSEGIKYKKNEVFIDVIESVNLLVSPPHPHPIPLLHPCYLLPGGRRGALLCLLTTPHVCILRSMPMAVSC